MELHVSWSSSSVARPSICATRGESATRHCGAFCTSSIWTRRALPQKKEDPRNENRSTKGRTGKSGGGTITHAHDYAGRLGARAPSPVHGSVGSHRVMRGVGVLFPGPGLANDATGRGDQRRGAADRQGDGGGRGEDFRRIH